MVSDARSERLTQTGHSDAAWGWLLSGDSSPPSTVACAGDEAPLRTRVNKSREGVRVPRFAL